MKTIDSFKVARYWIISIFAILNLNAADIGGFRAVTVVGDCSILEADVYQDVVVGIDYGFGRQVKTGRNSFLDLQFSQGNTFRLLARSSLIITEDVRNPKLKLLQLDQGTVDLQLDNFPSDHKLQVETPSAICGAVGTRFVVSFEDETMVSPVAATQGSRVHRFACQEGELQVASRFTIDNELVIGQSFAVDSVTAGSDMVAVIQEGLDNVYTDVTVNRGRLTFNYGGDDGMAFVVDAEEGDKPSRFTAAISKKDDGSVFVAFKMKKGFADFIFFGGGESFSRIGSADGAVLVPTTPAVKTIAKGSTANEQANAQLNAANSEGQEFAKLVDMQGQASGTEIRDQQKRVSSAAAKTNKTKNTITVDTPDFKPTKRPPGQPVTPDIPGEPKEPLDGEEESQPTIPIENAPTIPTGCDPHVEDCPDEEQ